jgi:hypothetical protein
MGLTADMHTPPNNSANSSVEYMGVAYIGDTQPLASSSQIVDETILVCTMTPPRQQTPPPPPPPPPPAAAPPPPLAAPVQPAAAAPPAPAVGRRRKVPAPWEETRLVAAKVPHVNEGAGTSGQKPVPSRTNPVTSGACVTVVPPRHNPPYYMVGGRQRPLDNEEDTNDDDDEDDFVGGGRMSPGRLPPRVHDDDAPSPMDPNRASADHPRRRRWHLHFTQRAGTRARHIYHAVVTGAAVRRGEQSPLF